MGFRIIPRGLGVSGVVDPQSGNSQHGICRRVGGRLVGRGAGIGIRIRHKYRLVLHSYCLADGYRLVDFFIGRICRQGVEIVRIVDFSIR